MSASRAGDQKALCTGALCTGVEEDAVAWGEEQWPAERAQVPVVRPEVVHQDVPRTGMTPSTPVTASRIRRRPAVFARP
ncbi:hypothetical protein [Streptomyces sp. CA-253872]|uniref:hypothetical protein n=1 Tax=Streptomyces sp. CA-253872 TaxID=3240067 RepID=UPI003D8E0392